MTPDGVTSFPLSTRGAIKLLDQTYRVIWDGEYCAHVHGDQEAAWLCLRDHDHRQRSIDKRTATLFEVNT